MKKRAVWRIMALALTLVMIVSLAVTAMAAPPVTPVPEETETSNGAVVPLMAGQDDTRVPPYQVNIYPNDYVSTPTDGTTDKASADAKRFKAYQIFTGDVMYASDAGRIPDDTTGFGWIDEGQLAGLGWGVSIRQDKLTDLLVALMSDDTPLSSLNITPADPGTYAGCEYLGQLFQRALIDAKYTITYTSNGMSNPLINPVGLPLPAGSSLSIASGNSGDATYANTASVVASVLADFTPEGTNNAALAQAFAKVVAKETGGAYEFLQNPEAESYWDQDHWVIGSDTLAGGTYNPTNDHLNGGYYLIVDEGDGVTSDVMVGVFGDVDVYVKADLPKPDKNILNYDDNGRDNSKGSDFELGDTIEFEITGTLRGNYADFKSYFFAFHDTLSDGLTYTGDADPQTANEYLKAFVTVRNPLYKTQEEDPDRKDYEKVEYIKIEITKLKSATVFDDDNKFPQDPKDFPSGANFYIEYLENAKPNLSIYFPDLKSLNFAGLESLNTTNILNTLKSAIREQVYQENLAESGLKPGQDGYDAAVTAANAAADAAVAGLDTVGAVTAADFKVSAQSVISVEYTAYLNENAKIDDLEGNPNSVNIEYSNDPVTGERMTSEDETVYTYDFGLQITKVDEKNPLKHLPGAGFAVVKEPQYPYFNNATDTTPAGWVGESELLAYLGEENAENLQDYLDGTVLPAGTGEPDLENKYLKGGTGAPTPTELYYAILEKVEMRSGVPLDPCEYRIAGWLPKEKLDTVLGSAERDKDGWKAAVKGEDVAAYLKQGFGKSADDTYYIAVETDADGELRIVGMEDGTYYLHEVYAPTGYQPLDGDISVRYVAEYYTQADIDGNPGLVTAGKDVGMLKTLTGYVQKPGEDAETEYKVVENGAYVTDGTNFTPAHIYDELVVQFDVENTTSVWVPGTGGMGTTLLYIGGGVLLAGAVVLLFVTNRKKSDEGKRAK